MTTKSEGMMIPGKLKWHIILVLALWLVFCGTVSAAELHVGSGQTYSTIRGAVDIAGDGDVIIVHAGSYTEHVDVDKQLTLVGEGVDVVTVTAASSASVFWVTADYVNISGFTVTGAGGYEMSGIYLCRANHCNISDNNAPDNWYGIHLDDSDNNNLANNDLSNNSMYSIWLNSSSNNTLANNTANSNEYGSGIHLSSSSNNDLTGNTVLKNDGYCSGIHLLSSSNNTLANNNVSNNYRGILLSSSSNNTLTNNTANSNNNYGIFLYSSSNYNILKNNTASHHSHGIYLSASSSNTIANNNVSSNSHGIYLHYHSNDNTLNSNTASNNGDGICLYSSSNYNTLMNNTINSNNYGIHLQYSSDYNDIVNNIMNSNDHYGICLSSSDNNNIASNNASGNGDTDIILSSSDHNTLTNNTANSHGDRGIYLWLSSSNTLTNNIMFGNNYNFGVYGDCLSHYIHNIDASNIVDGKPVYYWIDQQNNQITDDAGFVGVINSMNITVRNLTLTNNSMGVLFVCTNNSRIQNVTVLNNEYGIYMYNADDNSISCNWVHNNIQNGFYLTGGSTDNIIEHNNIVSNGCWNFYNSQDYIVEAKNNYWGTTDITIIDAGIREERGVVRFYPPAYEPVPCAPALEVLALQMAVGSIDTDLVADMNSDGKITSLDALMILQAAADNIEIG
jgi:parallel beta-helix repeat protein